MKKLLIIILIATSLSGLLIPAISYAWAPPAPNTSNPSTAITSTYQGYQSFVQTYGRDPVDQTEFTTYYRQYLTNKQASSQAQTDSGNSTIAILGGVNTVLQSLPGINIAKQGATAVLGAAKVISQCGISPVCWAQVIFLSIIQWVGNIILSLFSWILWLSGTLFNLSIITFVVNMKSVLSSITVIFTVWQTVRDLANMFFIFILLYIAIATIIDAGTNYKKMLTNVVLVALFINFSFFATGLLIDASNIVALQFYNGFSSAGCQDKALTGVVNLADGCMSYRIVDAIGITTIYGTGGNGTAANVVDTALLFTPAAGVGQLSAVAKVVIAIIMGVILMLVISIIFFASAILLIYRFVELIFLLMFSPLAFAFIILPGTKKYFDEWWNKLTTQLIFAPVYFMFLWIIMSVITATDANGHGILKTVLMPKDASFTSLFSGNNYVGMFGLIANFLIVIIMMWYALALSKRLGASGAETAMKAAGNIKGWVGRNTVGRAASMAANSQAMRDFRTKNNTLGRLAQAPLKSVAGYDFGGAKGGYEAAQKNFIKDEEEFAKTLGPDVVKVREAEVGLKAADEAHETEKNEYEANFKVNEDKLEADYKVAKERFDKAEEANKNNIGPAASSVAGKAKQDEFDESKKALERLDVDETRKEMARIKSVGKKNLPSYANKEKAQREVDQLKGVTPEDAKKRATASVMEDAKINGWNQEKIAEEIKKMTKDLIESNKGVAKTNQEAFAKAIEKGSSIMYPKATMITISNNVRKSIKGSDKDKLFADMEKVFGKKDEDVKVEKKEEKKEGGEK